MKKCGASLSFVAKLRPAEVVVDASRSANIVSEKNDVHRIVEFQLKMVLQALIV